MFRGGLSGLAGPISGFRRCMADEPTGPDPAACAAGAAEQLGEQIYKLFTASVSRHKQVPTSFSYSSRSGRNLGRPIRSRHPRKGEFP